DQWSSAPIIKEHSPPITLFLLTHKAQKKKLCKKENAVEAISLSAESDQGAAFGNRKLFKKSLSKNFARVVPFLLKLFLH
ncbi:MAG: hypothetical protein IKB84_02665, partial [Clostridia bacterium]|nr:hypothetical protein [Clostridia bacterium]